MNVINVKDKKENKDLFVNLHPMKKVEIIVYGEYEQMVASMMKEAKLQGYTLLRNVSGLGHHGFHEGKQFFNDKATLVMFIAVAPQNAISTIAFGLKELFKENSGVMFVSDVSVARVDYFS